MNTQLARLVMVFAFIPGIDPAADAEALVLDENVTEPDLELERHLGRQLKNSVLPLLHGTGSGEGELVVNVRVEPDGSIHVVNARSGKPEEPKAVEREVKRERV